MLPLIEKTVSPSTISKLNIPISFDISSRCPIQCTTFNKLADKALRLKNPIPYALACIKDITGKIFFVDLVGFYTHFKHKAEWVNPHSNKRCLEISYFVKYRLNENFVYSGILNLPESNCSIDSRFSQSVEFKRFERVVFACNHREKFDGFNTTKARLTLLIESIRKRQTTETTSWSKLLYAQSYHSPDELQDITNHIEASILTSPQGLEFIYNSLKGSIQRNDPDFLLFLVFIQSYSKHLCANNIEISDEVRKVVEKALHSLLLQHQKDHNLINLFLLELLECSHLDSLILKHFEIAKLSSLNNSQLCLELANLIVEQSPSCDINLTHAIALYERAITLDPENPIPYSDLALLWLKGGPDFEKNFSKGMEAYQKILTICPDAKTDWFHRTFSDVKIHSETTADTDLLIDFLDSASSLDAGNLIIWAELGRARLQRNSTTKSDLDKAVICFENCLELNSKDPVNLLNLAVALIKRASEEKKDLERAMSILNKALELNPDSFLAWYNLGLLWYRGGNGFEKNYSKAIESLKKATEIQPNDSKAWMRLGDVFSDKENNDSDVQSAIECYEQAIKFLPNRKSAHQKLLVLKGEAISRSARETMHSLKSQENSTF